MEQSGLSVRHGIDHPVDARGDDRQSGCRRLERHLAEPFSIARQTEDIRRRHVVLGPIRVVAPAHAAFAGGQKPLHLPLQAPFVRSCDEQVRGRVPRGERDERRGEVEHPLVPAQPAKVQEQDCVLWYMERGSHAASRRTVWPEPLAVYPADRALGKHRRF